MALYVNDGEPCRRFWVEQVGVVERKRTQVAGFTVAQVGFADQGFPFELIPREMTKDKPDDLDATPDALAARGVKATEAGDHHAMRCFAFHDPEGRWFALTR